MDQHTFDAEFAEEVAKNYDAAWTLMAESNGRYSPVGLVLAFRSHHNPSYAPFMIIGDIIWFPWASARNRVETAVRLVVEIRDTIGLVEYARAEHVPFFEMLCKHGIVRRVGKMKNVYPGEMTDVFETIPTG